MKNEMSSGRFVEKIFLFSMLFMALIALLILLFYRIDPSAETLPAEAMNTRVSGVILDAGHGGWDSGAVSASGVLEKNVNLAVAKKIGEFLEAEGVSVIYTRTEDTMLTSDKTRSKKLGDLMGRVETARANPDYAFISIHMNSLPQKQYSGLQVFYSPHAESSKILALTVQNDCRKYLQEENRREIKKAGSEIYVLDRLDTTAVLIECGFLSNEAEAEALNSEEYQNRLAFTISRSILSYTAEKKIF